jgi:hypothetical protein
MAESRHEVGIRLNGDASGLVGASKEAAEAQKGLAEQFKGSGDAAKRSAAEAEAFVRRLKEEADTLGRTRAQVEQYRASQLSLTDAQRRSVDASIAAIAAHDRKAQALASLRSLAVTATAAVTAYAGATVFAVKAIIDEAAELHNLSQSLGISTASLSAYRYQMSLAGVSNEEFNLAMRTLAKNISEAQSGLGDGAELFKLLGNELHEAARRGASFEQLLPMLADKFAEFADGPNKAALAMALFGRAGERMIPMLNQGAEGFRAAAREAEEFRRIIGPDMARRADEFNSNLTRTNALLTASKYAIAQEALPALNAYLEQLRVGVRIAGSFGQALLQFGTMNPFRSPRGNVVALEKEIAELTEGRAIMARLPGYEAAIADVDRQLRVARNRREFALFLQRQEALALIEGVDTGDQVSRMMQQLAPPKRQAPPLPKTGGAESRESDYSRLSREIRTHIELLELEAQGTEKVTQADRMRVQLYEAYISGAAKLNEEQFLELDALIETARLLEIDARRREDAVRSRERYNEALAQSGQARARDLEQMREANRRLEEHNAALGASTEELGRLQIRRAEEALALERQKAELAGVPEAAEGELEYYRERVRLAERYLDLTRQGAQRALVVEREKEAREQAKRITDDLERSLTQATVDGLRAGFERGESVAQNFLARLKEMFFSAVLTPIIQPIVRPVAQLVGGAVSSVIGGITGSMFPGVAQAGGGWNLASNAISLGNWFDGGGLGFLGGYGSGLTMPAAELAALVESGTVGAAGAGLEAAALGGIGGALPWVGGALLLGGALGLFDGGGGGPKPSQITLTGSAKTGFSTGDIDIPGSAELYAAGWWDAVRRELNDPKKYDPAVLEQFAGRWITGAPGESAQSMVARLLQMIEPARQAAMRATEENTRALQQLTDRVPQLEDALAARVRALGGQLGVDSLSAAISSLATSAYVAPLERFAAARAELQAQYERAIGGDLDAVRAFPGVVQQALAIGRDVYASGPQFAELFREGNRMLNELLAHQREIEADIVASVPATIREAASDQIAEIRRQTRELVDGLAQVKAEIQRLQTALAA